MGNKNVDKLIAREKNANGSEELLSLAIDIMRDMDDKEWAGKVFESALAQVDDCYDPCDMTRRIAIEFVDYTGDFTATTKAINIRLQNPGISYGDKMSLAYFFAAYPEHDNFRENGISLYEEIIKDDNNGLTCEEIYQQCAWLRDQLSKDLADSYLSAAEDKASSHWDFIGIAKEYAIAGDRENFARVIKMAYETACDEDDVDTVTNEEKEIIEYSFSE